MARRSVDAEAARALLRREEGKLRALL